jgi:hypothetical protein
MFCFQCYRPGKLDNVANVAESSWVLKINAGTYDKGLCRAAARHQFVTQPITRVGNRTRGLEIPIFLLLVKLFALVKVRKLTSWWLSGEDVHIPREPVGVLRWTRFVGTADVARREW